MKNYIYFSLYSVVSFLLVSCSGSTGLSSSNIVYASGEGAKQGHVIAKINGASISEEDLSAWLSGPDKGRYVKAKASFYREQSDLLESYVFDQLLLKFAAEKKKDKAAVYESEITKKIGKVSDLEVKKFYDDLAAQSKGRGNLPEFGVIKSRIQERLVMEKEAERKKAFFNELTHKYKVTYFLSPPRLDVAEGKNPALGVKGAPIKIVKFSDYQCGHCKTASATVKKVLKDYKGKVEFHYRDFPIFGKKSMIISNASLCAREEGKYWPYNYYLFEKSELRSIKDDNKVKDELIAYGKKLGINSDSFSKCVKNDGFFAELEDNRKAATALGLTGTPAFFINGMPVYGGLPEKQFKKLIDEELSRKNSKG